jgi:hypothetical protein
MELVDMLDLKSSPLQGTGSSPVVSTSFYQYL